MNEEQRKKLNRTLRKADSRIKFEVDEALADLRQYWDAWSADDRAAIKEWLDELAKLQFAMQRVFPFPNADLRVTFSEEIGEGDCRTFAPPIKAMQGAIECWEKGEHFAPKLGQMIG